MTGDHHGRTARRATLQVTATDEILGTHNRPTVDPALGVALGARSKSLLPAHPRGESHSQMEGFQAEDRHDLSPHIALSTIALKSAYRNTASLKII